MLRAILFDFNGVLVDDEPIHYELVRRVLEEEGVELEPGQYLERLAGRDDRSAFGLALERHGETPDPIRVTRLVTRKASYYRSLVRREGFPFFPGAVRMLREASAKRLRLGVVSGALGDEVRSALRQEDLEDLVQVLVTAEDLVEYGKPDPAGYRQALAELNARPPLPARLLHPHEVLAVEDTPAGIQAAQAAGLSTLGVSTTFEAEALAAADHVRGSLNGVELAELLALY